MEEDIKILEEYIDEKEGALKIWQIETINECEDLRVAIQNLIARYKELEKEKLSKSGIYKIDINLKEDYIPKSKVKEKIEELKKEMEKDETDEFGIHSIGWGCLDYTIDTLQELLEEV